MPEFDAAGALLKMDFGKPETLLRTLQSAHARGMALQTVLATLTANVARLLKWPHKGEIKAGADADLLVLDDDLSISDVMVLGQWHLRGRQQTVRGVFE